MTRRWLWLGGLVLVSVGSLAVGTSGAWFQGQTESSVSVRVPRVSGWLHLYSQGTDPYGGSGYADQVGNPMPAASGEDEGIGVQFVIGGNGNYTHARVLKVRTADAFPDVSPDPPVTSLTVTVTITPDAATGLQPIAKYGVDVWGAAPTYTKTITGWGPAVERQLNLQTKFPGKKFGPGTYTPHVVLTVTYAGMTTAFYQYTIPVAIDYM